MGDRTVIYLDENGAAAVIPSTDSPAGEDWLAACSPESLSRIKGWMDDPVMPLLLSAANQVPGVLLPLQLTAVGDSSYLAKAPAGEGDWFPASEIRNIQSLHQHRMSVRDLLLSAADMCQTLDQLVSMGIWGFAERKTVLLRNTVDNMNRFCLAGITDWQIYRYPQRLMEIHGLDTYPATTALRVLLGELALCLDDRSTLLQTESDFRSQFEEQLGEACIGELSAFFRRPSQYSPQRYLREAEIVLRHAADQIWIPDCKDVCLFILLAGDDCRGAKVPALSGAVRSFRYCLENLRGDYSFSSRKTVCIFPCDSVQINEFDFSVTPGLSAFPSEGAQRKRVPLNGLLDCLDKEIERRRVSGTASLVCCIELSDRPRAKERTVSCMEQFLIERLKARRESGIFDLIICSSDLRAPQWPISDLSSDNESQIINNPDELAPKMYKALQRLLEMPRYVMR